MKALQALEGGVPSAAYNLGNGRGFSVREVIDTVKHITGLNFPAKVGDRRDGDPAVLVSDAAKAQLDLGWRPRIAELSEIVRTAWAWHRQGIPSEEPSGRARAAFAGAVVLACAASTVFSLITERQTPSIAMNYCSPANI